MRARHRAPHAPQAPRGPAGGSPPAGLRASWCNRVLRRLRAFAAQAPFMRGYGIVEPLKSPCRIVWEAIAGFPALADLLHGQGREARTEAYRAAGPAGQYPLRACLRSGPKVIRTGTSCGADCAGRPRIACVEGPARGHSCGPFLRYRGWFAVSDQITLRVLKRPCRTYTEFCMVLHAV